MSIKYLVLIHLAVWQVFPCTVCMLIGDIDDIQYGFENLVLSCSLKNISTPYLTNINFDYSPKSDTSAF